MKYVISLDGRRVATFGSALKDMAEAELQRLQTMCIGTNSFPVLREEKSNG